MYLYTVTFWDVYLSTIATSFFNFSWIGRGMLCFVVYHTLYCSLRFYFGCNQVLKYTFCPLTEVVPWEIAYKPVVALFFLLWRLDCLLWKLILGPHISRDLCDYQPMLVELKISQDLDQGSIQKEGTLACRKKELK